MSDDAVVVSLQAARARHRPRQNSDLRSSEGLCNTLSGDKNCPPQASIGLDTISLAWRDQNAVDRFLRLDGALVDEDHRPLRVVHSAGGSVRLNRRLDGLGQVGAFPAASMLWIEGRAGALERSDESNHSLGAPARLSAVKEAVQERAGRLLGASLYGTPGVRRTDLSGELLFDRGEDGIALLTVLDQLHSPWHKTAPVRERGGPLVETAYWRTPRRSVPILRAYDKGIESGTADRGERVRLERQVRFKGAQRPSVEQWLSRDLARLYSAPLSAWIQDGVVAGDADALLRVLTDAALIWPTYWASGSSWASGSGCVHRRLWSPTKVERVCGDLALIAAYGASWPAWNAKQRQRRMREIRELGLLLTDHPVRVDVDQALTSLCDLWRAAA